MLWFIFTLLSALFESFTNVFSKIGAKKVDEYSAAWSQRFFALILLVPLAIITHSYHALNTTLVLVLLAVAVALTMGSILFFKALKSSPLSLTLPILAFTPAILLVTAPIINKEVPTILAISGVILVVIGSYVLNLEKRSRHFFAPLTSLVTEKGSRQMLMVAFFWSIGANSSKIGIQYSNPLFFATLTTATLLVTLSVVLIINKISFSSVLKKTKTLAPIGISSGISWFFYLESINLALVTNVIAVKRISIVFSSIWGKMFFKEKRMKERFLGAIIMILGVALITLGS